MAYTDLGRYREAENVYRRAVRLARARRAEARPVLATALNNLGALYAETGKLAVARQRLAESLRIHEQIASPSSELFPVLTHLADVLLQLGKPREASRLHDRALAACEKAHGRNAWQTGVVLNNIASLRFREKRYKEAAEVQQSAIEILTLQLGAEHPRVAEAMANLAAVRLQLGDLDEADRQVRQALESLYATHPEDHPRIADLLLTQSRVLAAQGNKKKSREVRRQANAILNQSRDENLLDHTVDVSAFQ